MPTYTALVTIQSAVAPVNWNGQDAWIPVIWQPGDTINDSDLSSQDNTFFLAQGFMV